MSLTCLPCDSLIVSNLQGDHAYTKAPDESFRFIAKSYQKKAQNNKGSSGLIRLSDEAENLLEIGFRKTKKAQIETRIRWSLDGHLKLRTVVCDYEKITYQGRDPGETLYDLALLLALQERN